MLLRVLLASAAVTAAAVGLGACGKSDQEQVRAVFKEFQRASKEKDTRRVCELMTPYAQAQLLGLFGVFGGGGGDCVSALKKTTPDEEEQPSARDIDSARLAIRNDRAVMRIRGQENAVGFRKVSGDWRVDNVLNPSLDERARSSDPRLTRGSDEEQVRATASAMVDAFARKDYARACGLFGPAAEAQILFAGAFASLGDAKAKESDITCPRVLRKIAALGDKGTSELEQRLPPADRLDAARVSIRGDHATVTVGGEEPVGLVRFEDRWLVNFTPPARSESKPATPADYRRCWRRAGAQIATSSSDLRFADNDQVQSTSSRTTRVSVRGDDWRIFYTRSEDGDDDPGLMRVLEDPRSVDVVAYIRNAPARPDVVAKARECGPQGATVTVTPRRRNAGARRR